MTTLLGRRVGGFWLLHHDPWALLVIVVVVVAVAVYLQRRR